jgi:hypothetical protein
MGTFLKKRWFLSAILTLFVLFKIPHLYYAYYWDESSPYVPAIFAMYHHGISLLPSAVDPELSRGHPLLFHALAAGWTYVFGTSHLALHSFSLFVAVVLLIVVYETGMRIFNTRVAQMALLLTATQVVFFVQSSFLLPEVLVALLAFLSLCCYVREQYVLTAIFLTALFFTKESGMIMGFVLGIDSIIAALNKNSAIRARLSKLVSVGVPCVLIAIFFLLQKQERGWYIFPFHAKLIELNWKAFWFKFRMACVRVAFYENLKYWYFVVLMLLAVVAAIKNRSAKYLALLLPGIIIYYFVDDMRAGRILPAIPFFSLFIVACGYFLYTFSRFFEHVWQRKFIVLAGSFIICFLCFSTINYFTYRYLLVAIVPLFFITSVFYDLLIAKSYPMLYLPLITIILAIGFFSFSSSTSFGDADLGAFNGVDVEQHIVDFLEQHNYYDQNISSGSSLECKHLTDPATGFLRGTKVFKIARWDIDRNTSIVIFTNLEEDARYNDVIKDTSFHLEYRYEHGTAWGEIYHRK